jgi:hypothetical protein
MNEKICIDLIEIHLILNRNVKHACIFFFSIPVWGITIAGSVWIFKSQSKHKKTDKFMLLFMLQLQSKK